MPRQTKQNKICTPELLEQVSPENKQLIKDFLSYLQSIQRSQTTIEAYEHDLQIWSCWNVQFNQNKLFVDLTKRNIVAYQDWLLNVNENSPARVRRLKSALSSMADYVELILDDEYPTFRNTINKIASPPNQPVREKTVFEKEDLDKLLSILVERKQYQKACCVALAMSSGARKSELTRFKVSYFDENNIINGMMYKTPEKIKTKGRGHQGKQLTKYTLVESFKPYFDLWMKQREELGVDSEWLLVSKSDDGKWEQIKPETLNSWANTFTKLIGIDFYFHSLRHYLVGKLESELNIPANLIKTWNGWASVALVDVYRDRDETDELIEAFNSNEEE